MQDTITRQNYIAKLQCKIAKHNCKEQLQGKFTRHTSNYITNLPKLQSQIAMQKYNAKLQGKITMQNYKAKATLHGKIARQNRKAKLQCKIARQHYKAKLQGKIAKQSYNAQLQDKILFFVCGPSPDGALRGAGLSSVGWGLHKKIASKIHNFLCGTRIHF